MEKFVIAPAVLACVAGGFWHWRFAIGLLDPDAPTADQLKHCPDWSKVPRDAYRPSCREVFRVVNCSNRMSQVPGAESSLACYRFYAPAEYQGLWITGFEASYFLQNASSTSTDVKITHQTPWLEFANWPKYSDIGNFPVYDIRFIGRKSAQQGWFGHMGLANSEFIVEKLEKIRRVPDPRVQWPTH